MSGARMMEEMSRKKYVLMDSRKWFSYEVFGDIR